MKTRIFSALAALVVIGAACVLLGYDDHRISSSLFPTMFTPQPEAPDERMRWREMMRGTDHDPNQLIRAKEKVETLYAQQLAQGEQRDAGLNSWSWKGPGNIGGRVRGLAIKNNGFGDDEIILGSAGGGIWTSTNAGASWTAANDFLPTLAISSIQIDPVDDDIMYAGTGEGFGNFDALPGAGIFKTTDGGVNWNQLPSTANDTFRYVQRVAIRPDSANVIFAACGSGRVLRSRDAGNSWTMVHQDSTSLLDLKINPVNGDHIAVGGDGLLLQSFDGGDNWANFVGGTNQIDSTQDRIEIAFAPTNGNYIYVAVDRNGGEVWRSTNGGTIWNLRSSGSNYIGSQGWYNNAIWVDPTNEERIVVGGLNIWRSDNGGSTLWRISTWEDYHNGGAANSAHADQHIFIPSIDYTVSTPIVYVGNDGGVQRIDNIWTEGSGDWHNLANFTMGITQFFGGAAAVDGSFYVGGAQDNSFSVGNLPSNWSQPTTGDGGYAAVDPTNSNIVYANTNHNSIHKSTDGGVSFGKIADFNEGAICGPNGCVLFGIFWVDDDASLIGHFIMDPNDPDVLLVGAERLWKNDDAGDPFDWVPIKGDIGSTVVAIDTENNSSDIWVGYSNSHLQMSSDSGNTWSANLGATLAGGGVTDISIDPNHPDTVAVTTAGNGGYVHVTEDGGTTWFDRSLPVNIRVNTVRWHPVKEGWLYVGTDIGVFASENWGVTWSVIPIHNNSNPTLNNEGPVYTEVSELFWQGNGSTNFPYYLCAATHGRGMWVSTTPVLDVIYVDKNYVGNENGTFFSPYNTFEEALDAAGPSVTIAFKSTNSHDEAPPALLINKKINIEVLNGPVIIE